MQLRRSRLPVLTNSIADRRDHPPTTSDARMPDRAWLSDVSGLLVLGAFGRLASSVSRPVQSDAGSFKTRKDLDLVRAIDCCDGAEGALSE